MGDLLRAESEKQTQRGAQVRAYVQSGDILPWAIAESIFRDHLEGVSAPLVILDGMPRNLDQVVHLESLLKTRNGEVCRVVFLDVGDDELIRRIKSRFQCAQCGMSCTQVGHDPLPECRLCKGTSFLRRSDDQAGDVLVHRLEVYHQMTRPVMDYYRDRGLLFLLDGTQPIDVLQEQLIQMVKIEMGDVGTTSHAVSDSANAPALS
jgi:adenylate kinase